MITMRFYSIITLLLVSFALQGTDATSAKSIFHHMQVLQELKTRNREAAQTKIAPSITTTALQTATESYLSDPLRKNTVYTQFKLASNGMLQKLVDKAIAREKEHVQDYYVFYHGQMFEFRVLQDVITLLTQTLRLQGKMHNFVYLRGPEKNSYPAIAAQDYVDSLYKTIGPLWDDCMPDTQKMLLSVNLSLFGNTTYIYASMCSFAFFLDSRNITAFQVDRLAEKFFLEHGFTTAALTELVNLTQKYKTAEGNLLQIFIPKNKVDECAYICYGYGIPCDTVLDAKCWNTLKKRHTRIRPILETYRTNPNTLPDIDRLQARLVMSSATLMNPDSGIKIFRYTTLSKELKKQYKAELKAIVDKVVINAIEMQKSIPQSCPFGKLVHLITATTNKPAGNDKAASNPPVIVKPIRPTTSSKPLTSAKAPLKRPVAYKKASSTKKNRRISSVKAGGRRRK